MGAGDAGDGGRKAWEAGEGVKKQELGSRSSGTGDGNGRVCQRGGDGAVEVGAGRDD